MGEKSSVPVRRQDITAGQRASPTDTADARQEGSRELGGCWDRRLLGSAPGA